jgi:predicted MFS family arabinose efflux permease
MNPINIFEYETLAQAHLHQISWDYIQGGSEDEVTLRANRSAFERIRWPLGAILAGLLSEFIGVRPTLFVGAGGIFCSFVWLLFSPIRALE